jgi:putative hemolysin
MGIVILMGLIVLNGLFAMSEIALVTARKARLMRMADDGDTAAAAALEFGKNPTRFLSTIQIGITSIGILNGIVAESMLAAPLSQIMKSIGVPEKTAGICATATVVFAVTYATIVMGELVPKRLGQIKPEKIARLVARPMQVLAVMSRPFVLLLSFSTNLLLQVMGVRHDARTNVTEEDIHALLEEGSETGVIEQNQHEMVRNVFRLDDRKLGSLMTPRTDVVYLDVRLSPADNLKLMIESGHSRFPVCDGGLNKLLGVTHVKHALAAAAKGSPLDVLNKLRPSVYVPEALTGMDLLAQFRVHNMRMAFVVDEYGEVIGIVTLQDLLEALTGEFAPRNPDDAWAVPRRDGSWLLDGAIPIPEMMDSLKLESVPKEEKVHYHTLSGMIMLLLGHIPRTGDSVDWDKWRFEVVDMDGKRIDKVLAAPLKRIKTGNETDG